MAPRRKADRDETAAERVARLKRELEQAQADAEREAEEKAKEGPELVAAAFLFKWSMARLAKAGKLNEDYTSIAPQKQPKEAVIARDAGLSESQRHNVIEAMKKALAGL